MNSTGFQVGWDIALTGFWTGAFCIALLTGIAVGKLASLVKW